MILTLEAQRMQKKRKYKKKSPRAKLYKILDDLCREIVRKRDNNTCQKCGKPVKGQNSHPSHVYGKKAYPHMRHDLQNVKILCYYCHRQWWHRQPIEAYLWFKEKFPERYDYLQKRKQVIDTLSIPDLEDLVEIYKDYIKEK